MLWAGFFLLEGFDFGVGVLLPFVGRTETDRKVALRSIGPTWDGNEVWLLVAGGATFAAFPEWYASMFAGLYIPLTLVLAGLIGRGIAIEYRGKVATDLGRRWCDIGMVVGSLLPALLFGVAFADLIRGVKMDAGHHIIGGFWDLVTPFGLLGGLVTLGFFCFHGAVFLSLRTEGDVRDRAHAATRLLAAPLVVVAVAFLVWSTTVRHNAVSLAMAGVLAVALLASIAADRRANDVVAFATSALVALGLPVFVLSSLWPDVIPARNHAAWSLTVHNASSSHYTLVVMTVVALIFTPIVLLYQGWTYWVFRARVSAKTVGEVAPVLRRPAQSAAQAYLVPSGGTGAADRGAATATQSPAAAAANASAANGDGNRAGDGGTEVDPGVEHG